MPFDFNWNLVLIFLSLMLYVITYFTLLYFNPSMLVGQSLFIDRLNSFASILLFVVVSCRGVCVEGGIVLHSSINFQSHILKVISSNSYRVCF